MNVAIYGASGHTARFVIAELLRRSHTPVAIGRDDAKLQAALAAHDVPIERRIAGIESPEFLDLALRGTDAVINCAGPFLDTADALIEAALRARVNYVDMTAEQSSAISTFERYDTPARDRGIIVLPAAGFYGALGDLLATLAMRDWKRADRIDIATALDRWWPTDGTRRTGRRNTAPRQSFREARFQELRSPLETSWAFPEPFVTHPVLDLPFTETVLIPRHIAVNDVRHFINQSALRDIRNPETPAPVAIDAYGRSDQRWLIEVVAQHAGDERRVTARGRDIYATTAPLVVQAVEHMREQRHAGAFALGDIVDVPAFIRALALADGEITIR